MRRLAFLTALGGSILAVFPLCAAHAQSVDDGEAHWEYDGRNGPDMWGALNPSYLDCASGMQQSPVNLTEAVPAAGGSLDIQWQPAQSQVVDNGHTIQVNLAEGGSISLEGRRFSLLQFHFHLPGEHTVDGGSFPMEAHFVHQSEEGNLAVVGVFMAGGEAHPMIGRIWDAIPAAGETAATLPDLDPNALLPEGRTYFRYAGSLTTPPCSEVVSWVVLDQPISVSSEQIEAFAALYPMNARPVQALNRRFILAR